MLITNARVVKPDGIEEGGWLLARGGVIAGIGASDTPLPPLPEGSLEVVNGGGGYLLPGFIDLHVHGGAGCDFMTAGAEELTAITRFHAAHGTTAMLATTVTASRDELSGVLSRVGSFMRTPMPYSQLLGVHLEGPFLNPEWKGAQNAAHMHAPQPAWLQQWTAEHPGLIRLQTLAPELEGAGAYIRSLREHGIVAACGHTNADYDEVLAAAGNGLTHAVHTFNAMRPLHHREPGTVGAVLTDPRIMAEVIADGRHVHPGAIRLLLQAKGTDGVILVTDAVSAAGMPDGDYELGGLQVVVADGTARLRESDTLAGSTLTMLEGFRYMVREVGVTVEAASRMASGNPAGQLGLQGDMGSLEPGKRADILLLDGELRLAAAFIGGRRMT